MNLNSLPRYQKTKIFITAGNKDFNENGMFKTESERYEYERLGLHIPLYAMYGKYMPGKGYTLDPMADSIGEMQSRIIIW